jgi:GT2 family glycosyltransferase
MIEHDHSNISIIIVTFNSEKFIKSCLDSIFTHLPNVEIIVVDNASADNSVNYLRTQEKKSKIKLLCLNDNIGFGAANNHGANLAKGEYLLFLNADTLLVEDPISKTTEFLDHNPNIAVYSCQLRNRDNSVQPTGGYFPNLINTFAWQFFLDDLPVISSFFKSIHPKSNLYHQCQYLDWLTGAFFLINKHDFIKIKGFDEKIFMYTEELELCFRLNKLGKKCFFNPESHIIHYGGGSGGSYLAITLEIKNLIYFYKKHLPRWQLPILKLILICGCLLRWLFFGIIRPNGPTKKAYLDALRCLT